MMFVRQEPALQMMLSVYVTLGIFLLLAARNPSAYRSLIAFAAWSSFAHAVVMCVQAWYDVGQRLHFLIGDLALLIIGVALIALSPAKLKMADAGPPEVRPRRGSLFIDNLLTSYAVFLAVRPEPEP